MLNDRHIVQKFSKLDLFNILDLRGMENGYKEEIESFKLCSETHLLLTRNMWI